MPRAPETATAVHAAAPIGDYDALRIGGRVLPARLTVQRDMLATVLVSVARGQPVPDGVYASGEAVSLGLNELAGQLRPMPAFTLTDQFGRRFDNASIAGHVVVLAAFHTTCRETCPLYTGLFMQLRRELPPDVLLVEATTDPWGDSPDELREYAGRVGASWTFVTGDPAALAAFRKPFDVGLSTADVHSSTLALIDAHGYTARRLRSSTPTATSAASGRARPTSAAACPRRSRVSSTTRAEVWFARTATAGAGRRSSTRCEPCVGCRSRLRGDRARLPPSRWPPSMVGRSAYGSFAGGRC